MKLNTSLLFKLIVETPKEKGKRKKEKSPEWDEGTHLVAEPFCFVKPISYYQDRIKRHDETVVKQPRPQGLLSFFQFIGGKPREENSSLLSCRHIAARNITGQRPDFSARRRRPNLHSNHRKSVSNNRQGN